MSGKFVLIPLKTFRDLCCSTKKSGNKITGTVQSWSNLDEPKKPRSSSNKRYATSNFEYC